MISADLRVRKWGHSLGLVIPKEEALRHKLKAGEEVRVIVVKKVNVLKDIFGTLKFDEPVEKIMKDTDRMLYND